MKTITNCFKFLTALLFCALYSLCGCTKEVILNDLGNSFTYNPSRIASGITIGNVYHTNNFAAFTDITYYNNAWYIVFRAGTKHVGGLNGEIKVLKSNDAITWTVQDIIVNDTLDLRDSKFVIDSIHNNLYLNYRGIKYEANGSKVFNFLASYNSDIENWNNPQLITNDITTGEKFVFWRFTYSKGKMYSAAYRSPILGGYATDNICLFNNKTNFETYAAIGKLDLGKSPNEATIRFDESDNMYFLIRREAAHVALGISTPADYTKVKWLEDPLFTRLSSPNFLFYNNKLLICGRDQDDSQFKIFSYNLITNKV